MDLAIIIVSWNVREKLRDNLRAFFASKHLAGFEVFVVDNNSHDGTAAMVRKEYPQVRLIANQKNLGFAKANNQALRIYFPWPQLGPEAEQPKYVLLLNPDMRVFDDTLSNMVAWLDRHEKASVAGCKLIDENGKLVNHVRRFPAFLDQLAIVLKLPHLVPGVLDKYLRPDFDYEKAASVDSVRGGFFMLRAETIKKIGLLDERYFLWFEEVDYCRRVKEAGGQVWYTNAAECIDLVGQSFKQVGVGLKQKYFRESMLKYFKKWQPAWQYWLLKSAWLPARLLVWLGEKLKMKGRART